MELNRREAQKVIIERTKAFTESEEFDNATFRTLKNKEKLLKQAFEKFQDEHGAIIETTVEPKDLDVQHEFYRKVEETYVVAVSKMEARFDALEEEIEEELLKERGTTNTPGAENAEGTENGGGTEQDRNSEGQNGRSSRLEHDEFLLERFKPPKFNGTFTKWSEWKSAFESMIHESSLNDTRKLYLLKQCLTGNAERLLSGWLVVGKNYELAYKAVCDVYDNEYRIKMAHLDELYAIPKANQETYEVLRTTIDTTNCALRQLEVCGSPVDKWDEIISHFLINKMSPQTLSLWESAQDHSVMPQAKTVLKFLEKRARARVNYSQASSSTNNNNHMVPNRASLQNQQNTTGQMQMQPQMQSQSKGAIPKQRNATSVQSRDDSNLKCNNCGQPHQMYRCSKFLQLSCDDRANCVREKGLCSNCFSANHKAGSVSCKYGPCKRCKKLHNSLLCKMANTMAVNTVSANTAPFRRNPSFMQTRENTQEQNETNSTFYQTNEIQASQPEWAANQSDRPNNGYNNNNRMNSNQNFQ